MPKPNAAALLLPLILLGAGGAFAAPSAETAAPRPDESSAASPAPRADPAPDLSTQPTLYLVGYAHLDTEWRWEYPQTIRELLPKTLDDNFRLFEEYPHYVFNFSGANRYRMMEEYYPKRFERLKREVRAGRWFPAGSAMEEGDVNMPSAESILRQILYGTHYFRRELGRTSSEYMLPDCFGFPASLPSLLAHMGLKGFSTQKLTWGSAVGIPFNVGVWEGPDGRGVIAALNPGSYGSDITYDVSKSEPAPGGDRHFVDWPARVRADGEKDGVYADYHYYGTGDTGGAPSEASVAKVESIVTHPGGPLHVVSATAEQMFEDITPAESARLPRYQGDLELTQHSAGSLTSQAVHKGWNHENELLADAAERASVAAAWLGGRAYPLERLNDAWTLVMGGQFHDIAAGTATPRAYQYTWNDDVLAMNQFAAVLTSASEAVASALDTRTEGIPVVVYNPLEVEREDVIEADLPEVVGAESVRVVGPDGRDVPAQISRAKVIFLARVPSVGFAVYDVRPGAAPASGTHGASPGGASAGELSVSPRLLENARYRLRLDDEGDVASLYDKKLGKELLASPIRLAFQTERPHDWPAWNMDWSDQQKPPRGFVDGPATVRVVERGPARAALEVSREAEGSRFTETIRLTAGDAGNRVEIADLVDWRTSAAALKATFPLTASNPEATYSWDVGTVRRGNDDPKKYEVASHQWFDLTDRSGRGGAYGVTVLSGSKLGSDKPDDRTLRLTLLYTPGLGDGNANDYSDQATQDWGQHEIVYGLAAHAGGWRGGGTDWQARRLDRPAIAFVAHRHPGALGRTFSLLHLDDSRVRVLALKKAEDSDEWIVRVVELDGREQRGVHLAFAAPILDAHEVDGQERPLASGKDPVRLDKGELVTDLGPYQLRTFALTLAPSSVAVSRPHSTPLAAPEAKMAVAFDAQGRTPATERLPAHLDFGGVSFRVGAPTVPGGETIDLPAGTRRVDVLVASDGNRPATFRVGDLPEEVMVQDWTGFIGQADLRDWSHREEAAPPRPGAPPDAPPRRRHVLEMTRIEPGFIHPAPVAWFADHRYAADGTVEPYAYSYLFDYSFEVPTGASTFTLPDDPKLRVLAVTASDQPSSLVPALPLYGRVER